MQKDKNPVFLSAISFIYQAMQQYDNPDRLTYKDYDYSKDFDIVMLKSLVETFESRKTINTRSMPAYKKLMRLISNILLLDDTDDIYQFIDWVSLLSNLDYDPNYGYFLHEDSIETIYFYTGWIGYKKFKNEYLQDINKMVILSSEAGFDYNKMMWRDSFDNLIDNIDKKIKELP